MKLRNLLFGTMIACVFAACSNEDDPILAWIRHLHRKQAPLIFTIVVKKLNKEHTDKKPARMRTPRKAKLRFTIYL